MKAITTTGGGAISILAFDTKYLEERNNKVLKAQPKGIMDGLGKGIKRTGGGFYDAITGVVKNPAKGAKHEGFKGFCKGTVRGLTGLFVKPVVG